MAERLKKTVQPEVSYDDLPDENGHFGPYGGRFVAETLMGPIEELRQAYERYVKALEPAIMTVGGRPIWRGEARFTLIGPSAERWDEVILVAYPRRQAFERLLATREYRAAVALRSAALEDSRLIVTIAPQAIGRVAWSLYKLGAKLHRRAPR